MKMTVFINGKLLKAASIYMAHELISKTNHNIHAIHPTLNTQNSYLKLFLFKRRFLQLCERQSKANRVYS